MPKLTEDAAERLRTKTVDVLLALRASYLKAGANALKHWTQIEDRVRAATRQTATVPEWVSAVKRGLQVSETSSSLSRAATELVDELELVKASHVQWLDMVEREVGYLMALARLEAEDRKSRRKTAEEN